MTRAFIHGGVLLMALTWTSVSLADPVVQGVALSVERVFGYTRATMTEEQGDSKSTATLSGLSLGSSRSLGTPAYSMPRLGLDYVLPMGVSFGAAFGVASMTLKSKTESPLLNSDVELTATDLLLAPRVGYMLAFDQQFGVWPRIGFSYASRFAKSGGGDSSVGLGAFTVEAPFVFAPNKSFGFMATPALDLGVLGSSETDGQESEADISMTEVGLTLGMFVAF